MLVIRTTLKRSDALQKNISDMEQETLEEAAKRFTSKYYSGEGYERDIEEAVKFGAQWMQEQMEKLKDFDIWKEWKNETFKSE